MRTIFGVVGILIVVAGINTFCQSQDPISGSGSSGKNSRTPRVSAGPASPGAASVPKPAAGFPAAASAGTGFGSYPTGAYPTGSYPSGPFINSQAYTNPVAGGGLVGPSGTYAFGRPVPFAGYQTQYDQVVDPAETAKFQAALNSLRTAASDEEKTKARAALGDLVSEQLDRDIDQREKVLTDIEARVKDMRAQLDERKRSKPEIQKMILLMIEQPQVGLGLPRVWMDAIQPSYPQGFYNYSQSSTYPGNASTTYYALPSGNAFPSTSPAPGSAIGINSGFNAEREPGPATAPTSAAAGAGDSEGGPAEAPADRE